jgi:hypothetical protein
MFTVRFRAQAGTDGIKALRWVLKKAKRLGLIAVDAREEEDAQETRTGQQTKQSNIKEVER